MFDTLIHLYHELIDAFRQGVHEREVTEFTQKMLDAVMDATITDEEVDRMCDLYERFEITPEEWDHIRNDVWQAALKAAAPHGINESELRELRGIRCFLGLKVKTK